MLETSFFFQNKRNQLKHSSNKNSTKKHNVSNHARKKNPQQTEK